MNKFDIIEYLSKVEQNLKEEHRFENIKDMLKREKELAVQKRDEILAKEYWCLEMILRTQNKYISAYNLLKQERYYDAWCDLEQSQLSIHFLSQHQSIDETFNLKFINDHISKYQSIFPYKSFMSTEFLENEFRCSICDQVLTPRARCIHKVGEIYGGEMCSRKITSLEVLGIAMVSEPAHKYAVPFIISDDKIREDNYDYAIVKYLIDRLVSPFDKWDVDFTKRRHPHSRFKNVGRNDQCPCESHKKYKNCCLKESGVLRPHIEFLFENPPSPELLKIQYT